MSTELKQLVGKSPEEKLELAQQQGAVGGVNIFDPETCGQIKEIAVMMAATSMIPLSLRAVKKGENWEPLPEAQVVANCFRVAEQAHRWQLSPFAVVDCASVVHGRLMWEGKVVSAVLETIMGIRLSYEYEGSGSSRKVVVSGRFPNEESPRTIEGTVADWKTDQWKASAFDQRLAYRGAREWARRHAPGAILGVYSPDEMDGEDMRDVTPRQRGIQEREQVLNPAANMPKEPSAPEDSGPTESESKPESPEPRAKKIPATGRQKKDRYERDATFKRVTEMVSQSGKTFFALTANIGVKEVEFVTFSKTMGENLMGLEEDQIIRITFTIGPNDRYELQDFVLLEDEKEEGGLI